jgi:hypothetical protein
VAKRRSTPRGRSRKRRGSAATVAEGAGESAADADTPTRPSAPGGKRTARRRPPERGAGRLGEQLAALGERPQAPWHPLPLSELLILVGLIGTVLGYTRHAAGRALLFAGVGAVTLGTLEFTLREHLSGYKPHTTLLAIVPTAVLHGGLAVALATLGAPPTVSVIGPLALDVPVFAFLFRLLRGRFFDARSERRFAAGR